VSGQASDHGRSNDRRGRFDWLTLGAAFLSFFLTINLVLQNAQSLWGTVEIRPSPQSAVTYWVVAGILIAVQAGLLARAIRQQRGGLILVSLVALVFAVGASLIIATPRGETPPAPPATTSDSNYSPCYTGSGDCPGG
jgi:hypothetical protein